MKKYLALQFLFFCYPIFQFYSPVYAQEVEGTQMAVAYKCRDSEPLLEETDKKIEQLEIIPGSISLQCNEVESGNPIPYPQTTVSLTGKFYRFKGKSDWLPPDPGEAGKSTIEGLDSDGDCVRDDIERVIAELLPYSNQVMARKYMFEYAKWRGQFLKDGLSEEDYMEISRNLYISGECVLQNLEDDIDSTDLFDKVFSKFHNTYPRSYRYIDNNVLLGGWTTREDIIVTCP